MTIITFIPFNNMVQEFHNFKTIPTNNISIKSSCNEPKMVNTDGIRIIIRKYMLNF